jgi:hypothetical protein
VFNGHIRVIPMDARGNPIHEERTQGN